MDLMEQSLRAKYRINNNLYITCYLDIIDATAEGFLAQVGIRVPGDTVIPIGTKLYLASSQVKHSTPENKGFINLFYVAVKGVEINYGVPVQVCSPICRETRPDMRQRERMKTQFNIEIEEMGDAHFIVVEGSTGGLTVLYQASKVFAGLVLGNKYKVNVPLREETLAFPVRVTHILYDWRTYQHLIGVEVLELTQSQEFLLSRIIDPNAKTDISQHASIDTEEARIRQD